MELLTHGLTISLLSLILPFSACSFSKPETKGESCIKNGRYVQTPMHVDGIPDGICFEVSIAKQLGGTCAKSLLTYLMQRLNGIDDTHVLEYRESNQYYSKIRAIPNLEDCKDKDLNALFATFDALAIITSEIFSNEILFLHTGIDVYRKMTKIPNSLERDEFEQRDIENYFVFDCSGKNLSGKKISRKIKNIEYVNEVASSIQHVLGIHGSSQDLIKSYVHYVCNTVFNKLKNNERALILLAPVLGDWIAHALAFEIEPNASNSENPFKLICYDSLDNSGWRQVGAQILYDLLKNRSSAKKHPLDPKSSTEDWLNGVSTNFSHCKKGIKE